MDGTVEEELLEEDTVDKVNTEVETEDEVVEDTLEDELVGPFDVKVDSVDTVVEVDFGLVV